MRGYAISKLRILLPTLLLGVVVAITASSFGQDATPAPKTGGLFSIIVIDPISITVSILSVTGLTLIIQGFIQNRAEAMMPEATTQRIREMIEDRKSTRLNSSHRC